MGNIIMCECAYNASLFTGRRGYTMVSCFLFFMEQISDHYLYGQEMTLITALIGGVVVC